MCSGRPNHHYNNVGVRALKALIISPSEVVRGSPRGFAIQYFARICGYLPCVFWVWTILVLGQLLSSGGWVKHLSALFR